MFSLQRLLGRDDEFCALLEVSAQLGVEAVESLQAVIQNSNGTAKPCLDAFREARRRNKEITGSIADLQLRAMVTSFEREDIEAVAEALYKIPKTVEKFAERYYLSYERVRDFSFIPQVVLVQEATKSVLEMVQAFRALAGMAEIKRLDRRIQRLEAEADDVILHLVGQLIDPAVPTLRGIVLKDLLELNEKVVDRCRDASGVIARVTMRTS